MDTHQDISEIIKTTAKKFLTDSEVMLFGSRARKDFSYESDYDILIITNQLLTFKEKITIKSNIRKALLMSNIRSDILIQSKEEVEIKKRLPGHIIRTILKEAILL